MTSSEDIARQSVEAFQMLGRLPIRNGRRVVSGAILKENPLAIENAFHHLIGTTEYEALLPIQRPAHLVSFYDGEIHNGGHLQFFTNLTIILKTHGARSCVEETLRAVEEIGAETQAQILTKASMRWNATTRTLPIDLQAYCDASLEEEFADCDNAYYACPIDVHAYLKGYFAEHEADFIIREYD